MYWLAPYQLEQHVKEHQRRSLEDAQAHNRAKAARDLRRQQANQEKSPPQRALMRIMPDFTRIDV